MQCVTRISVLALILVMTLPSVLLVNSASAQSKPSIPDFKVKYVDDSYDVPTTYSIDSFTGENVTHMGYHVENKSLSLMVKNQPFSVGDLYYNVRVKNHASDSWTELYKPKYGYPAASGSEYTTITFDPGSNGIDYQPHTPYMFADPDGQVDFQVEAMVGSIHRQMGGTGGSVSGTIALDPWIFDGETSGWSSTQTVRFYYPAPVITILCPIQGEFNTSTVPLIFSVDEPVVQMQYNLDEGQTVTITGNVTLTDVPNGYHYLFVYVLDSYGNNACAEVVFTVNAPQTPQSSPENQSVTTSQTANYAIPALIVIIAVSIVFSFMITRRRKEKSGKS
jgi:hypothetical protein